MIILEYYIAVNPCGSVNVAKNFAGFLSTEGTSMLPMFSAFQKIEKVHDIWQDICVHVVGGMQLCGQAKPIDRIWKEWTDDASEEWQQEALLLLTAQVAHLKKAFRPKHQPKCALAYTYSTVRSNLKFRCWEYLVGAKAVQSSSNS